MLSSPASLGPPAASLSLCLFVPAQLEPDAVITSAVKGFSSRMGSKDVASTANEEMRFFSELWAAGSAGSSQGKIFGASSSSARVQPNPLLILSPPQNSSTFTPDLAPNFPQHSILSATVHVPEGMEAVRAKTLWP